MLDLIDEFSFLLILLIEVFTIEVIFMSYEDPLMV
jgi:hypothetical protein